jgi:hypothetical protein
MTIELKLDTNALSSLIEKDPEFQLKLQACVIENIARRHIKGVPETIKNTIEAAAKVEKEKVAELFGNFTSSWSQPFKLKESVIADIKKAINQSAKDEIASLVREAVKSVEADIKTKVETAVSETMIQYKNSIIKQEVQRRINEAIAQIKI